MTMDMGALKQFSEVRVSTVIMFFYRETFFLTKGKKTQNTKFVGVYRVILKFSSLKGNWQKIGIPREKHNNVSLRNHSYLVHAKYNHLRSNTL